MGIRTLPDPPPTQKKATDDVLLRMEITDLKHSVLTVILILSTQFMKITVAAMADQEAEAQG